MSSEHAKDWKKPCKIEFQSLMKHEMWELVPLPPDRKAVGSRWMFRIKRDENGEIERYKARFIVQGFSQRFGEDICPSGPLGVGVHAAQSRNQ